MATEKTSSGRAKNYNCPYCEQMFYSVHTLNMHIGAKHAGEKTIALDKRDEAKLKPFKAEKPKANEKPIDPSPPPKPAADIRDDWDPY